MKHYILDAYRNLKIYRSKKEYLELELEETLDFSVLSRIKFYFQNSTKKMAQRSLLEQRLKQLTGEIRDYEDVCVRLERWLKSKTAISEAMLIDLLKFLLSEYDNSEVLVRKGNIANELTREEILSLVRRNAEFSEYNYDYYRFLLVDVNEAYQLPVKDKYASLFHVFDMEAGMISETVTMEHPKLAQGIMDFLDYRIAHEEIDTEQILETFQEYYKKELNEFTKVKS